MKGVMLVAVCHAEASLRKVIFRLSGAWVLVCSSLDEKGGSGHGLDKPR